MRGSIPAGAGSPCRISPARREPTVYPRGCGVTNMSRRRRSTSRGLSPRVRGHPDCSGGLTIYAGSIPAGAGSPQEKPQGDGEGAVYPRGCGVTGHLLDVSRGRLGLSPRVRGHHAYRLDLDARRRSIPAGAGLPTPRYAVYLPATVYPRGCGATRYDFPDLTTEEGLSPRVRGYRRQIAEHWHDVGSIPAGAGLPLLQFVRTRALRARRSVYRAENAPVCRRRINAWRATAPPTAFEA